HPISCSRFKRLNAPRCGELRQCGATHGVSILARTNRLLRGRYRGEPDPAVRARDGGGPSCPVPRPQPGSSRRPAKIRSPPQTPPDLQSWETATPLKDEYMKPASRGVSRLFALLFLGGFLISFCGALAAEQLPLKHAVELALAHSTTIEASHIDEQRAFASYHEARNQYLPQLAVGSGLGKSYGYPLSLEGSAPSIVNTTAQFALINPALRDFVRAA